METFAIVDIETTGGSADQNGITEVAIRIWDGNEVIEKFSSLINPGIPIPLSIQNLTGITNEMVSGAPRFEEIAEPIYHLLKDSVFVAHNVHFDYSFLHHSLGKYGYELRTKKLCTVRLSRKILPGLPSYSLGRISDYFSIPHSSRHRADGDADATVLLFKKLQESDHLGIIPKSLKQESSLGKFPPKLNPEEIIALPEKPGVYYFKDEKGKVIYVGKAIQIKKRIISHFSGNSTKKQKQEFIQKIAGIHTEVLPTELMALIYESHEIKRLWPELNRAQKFRENAYGIFEFKDQRGFSRLAIDKVKPNFPPLFTISSYLKGTEVLRLLIKEFNLYPEFCFQKKAKLSEGLKEILEDEIEEFYEMKGPLDPVEYNSRVENAIHFLKKDLSFAILDQGIKPNETSIILIIRGDWVGIGSIPIKSKPQNFVKLIPQLRPLRANSFIRNSLRDHAILYPHKIIPISEDEIQEYEKAKILKQANSVQKSKKLPYLGLAESLTLFI